MTENQMSAKLGVSIDFVSESKRFLTISVLDVRAGFMCEKQKAEISLITERRKNLVALFCKDLHLSIMFPNHRGPSLSLF